MHQAWHDDFGKFYEDMGKRPTTRHTIERVDNDGDYEPGNCIWADYHTQAHNKKINTVNKSGVKGVAYDQYNECWVAYLTYRGERVLKRPFKSKNAAIKARKRAEYLYFGRAETP
jgi:hypothetical protein